MDQIEQKVTQLVRNIILGAGTFTQLDGLSRNTDLFAQGYLDSLLMVSLILSMEKEFAIQIPLDKITNENISSIDSIIVLVNQLAEKQHAREMTIA
jgi:acyl carrier protein